MNKVQNAEYHISIKKYFNILAMFKNLLSVSKVDIFGFFRSMPFSYPLLHANPM